MTRRDLHGLIQRIIAQETVFLRHYIGKVLAHSTNSDGVVKVAILELGCETEDTAFRCFPRDKNSFISPAVGDWVEVYFINGNRNHPVYMGVANEIAEMLPTNYAGTPTNQLLFEDNSNQIHISFDEEQNILEMGNTDMQFAARIEDETLSDNSTDADYWTFWSLLFGVIKGAPIPEPGSGAPSAFQAALALALAATTPSSLTGKINSASDQVKIGSA